MKTLSKKAARIKQQTELAVMTEEGLAFEARMAAIQMLIPVALERVNEDLQKEHGALVGERCARGKRLGPWRLQSPGIIDWVALQRVINGISTAKYEIDGGKGIHKGLKDVLDEQAVIARCQWHKRENVLEYLPKGRRDEYRRRLQTACEQPTYDAAKKQLEAIKRELRPINGSAVNSLEEGLEETLTLHKPGLFERLGVSFKTTNAIENVNAQLGICTDRMKRIRPP